MRVLASLMGSFMEDVMVDGLLEVVPRGRKWFTGICYLCTVSPLFSFPVLPEM